LYNPKAHHIWHTLDIAARFILVLPCPFGFMLPDADPRAPGFYLLGSRPLEKQTQDSRAKTQNAGCCYEKSIVKTR